MEGKSHRLPKPAKVGGVYMPAPFAAPLRGMPEWPGPPLEHEPEVFRFLAVKLDLDRFASRLLDPKGQLGFAGGLKTKIEIVAHRPAVNTNDPVVRTQLELIANAARRNFGYDHARPPKLCNRWCNCKLVHRKNETT